MTKANGFGGEHHGSQQHAVRGLGYLFLLSGPGPAHETSVYLPNRNKRVGFPNMFQSLHIKNGQGLRNLSNLAKIEKSLQNVNKNKDCRFQVGNLQLTQGRGVHVRSVCRRSLKLQRL